MQKKIVNWFTDFLFETYKLDITRGIVRIVIFVAVILPVILIASFSYRKIHQELTNVTFSQRQSVAYLAASALREKLDHLTDLGISLATPVKFRELIQTANWNDAVKTMDDAVKNFPSIDRIFLTDPGGTLMANVPTISEGMGGNTAFRDWFKGVRHQWKSYISAVYLRREQPQYNVFAIAVPIRADDQTLLGSLVLQIKLDTFLRWTQEVSQKKNPDCR